MTCPNALNKISIFIITFTISIRTFYCYSFGWLPVDKAKKEQKQQKQKQSSRKRKKIRRGI